VATEQLRFVTLEATEGIPSVGANLVVLGYNNWDDWFEFETSYSVFYFDADGKRHAIGGMKIGEAAQATRRALLPREFTQLEDRFFSIGLSEDFYRTLHELGISEPVLTALNDIAYDLDIYKKFAGERVTNVSLFRTIDKERIVHKFHRLATGDVELTEYAFSFTLDRETPEEEGATLTFEVKPGSQPPSNIHVLIGRNGVGKTTCLNNIAKAFVDSAVTGTDLGDESSASQLKISSARGGGAFANLISVTFSAFDPFFTESRETKGRYSYVGLKEGLRKEDREVSEKTGILFRIKGPDDLTADFVKAGKRCLTTLKKPRWRETLENLASDPIFEESEIIELTEEYENEDDWAADAARVFRRLSSGHKIVLLTVTRLVELVEEQSLVLLDEPESHLHPPLLSAFIRTLSDLLTSQNGVAIVATHSPVVLQETPRDCSWILDRSGATVRARRPLPETFGENVGLLTHEVFGLEVSETGFYELLRKAAAEHGNYDAVVNLFGNELGSEARAILHALLPKIVERVR
jgi:predicted ATPase